MKIEIWSDFVCPFCYMGETILEKALLESEHKGDVEITFRSFQLDPNAVRIADKNIYQIIAEKYGISYEQSKAANDDIVKAGRELGLNYQMDIMKPNNTAMAHEISKFAQSVGKETILAKRLFKAYFEEGADIGDKVTLLNLAAEVGLNLNELNKKLDEGFFKSEVLQDQEQARALGINSVPHFVINNKYTISGAQGINHFIQVLNKAYLE
jgi:predicted DsbA family dithiol-disulfide isomerase